MRANSAEIVFEERQHFRQPWLWILIAVTSVTETAMFGWALYQQLYLGKPWGTNPVSDRALLAIAVVVFVTAVGIPILFCVLKLSVRIDGTHIHVRFFPFTNRRIPLASIAMSEVRTYRPILEYGGWGIRWSVSGKGWAYNVSGNRGVQLELTDGKRVLIGSQRPEALAEAIKKNRPP